VVASVDLSSPAASPIDIEDEEDPPSDESALQIARDTPPPLPDGPKAVPSPEQKAAIARAVARAAVDAAEGRPEATDRPAPRKKTSRLASLAERAVRPRSALEAARAAAAAEAQNREVEAANAAVSLVQRVRTMIPECLPDVGQFDVKAAIDAGDRDVFGAVWRSHRAKFLRDGELERAVGAAAVLHALETRRDRQLVAAHVVTNASDYLLWLDMREASCLAAFSDAQSYFAG